MIRYLLSIAFAATSFSSFSSADEKLPPDHVARMKKGTTLFRASVRGILERNCLACHGGDTIEAGFSLATRKLMLKGGESGPGVTPGKPETSKLFLLVSHKDKPGMPLDEERLPEKDIEAIREWISLGAPFDRPLADPEAAQGDWTTRTIRPESRDFWAFKPLSTPQVPAADPWCRSTIDRFILQALRKQNIEPQNDATRIRLIRRACFDLTGLPPEPELLTRTLADQSADWFQQLVDHLLESPHFGEHMARQWLDAARFGESHGFEQDYDRAFAYHYRDFVIKAFNADMPWTQFVQWQLAGDELAPEEPLALMATGFMGAGVFPTQLTEKEFEPARYDELDDIVATMGTAMLGMTIGCARCHDHKFDPIPAADYYQLISTFGTTIRSHQEVELHSESLAEELEEWQGRLVPLEKALRNYEQNTLPGRFTKWLQDGAADPDRDTAGWMIVHPMSARSMGGATMTVQDDNSILATGRNPDFDTYIIQVATSLPEIQSLRLEALAHESLVRKGPGRADNGNMGVGQITVEAEPLTTGGTKKTAVRLKNPRATFEQNKGSLSIAASIDNRAKTGWAVDPQFGRDHAAAFDFEQPLRGFAGGTRLTVTIKFDVNNRHNIGRTRLSISDQDALPLTAPQTPQAVTEILDLVRSGKELTDPAQRTQALKWFRTLDPGWRKHKAQVDQHQQRRPQAEKTTVMVSTEGLKPLKHHADGRGFKHFYPETFFLKRGDTGQKIRAASPGFLQVLSKGEMAQWHVERPKGARTSMQRSGLAKWITDTENGAGILLARVIVNRLWQQHFGQGLVATANDFGRQGDLPSHPELLDWLARELIRNGWHLKPIHRLMVTSSTWRQSSDFNDQAAEADPQNRLLWRHVPRRLQAESIRDSLLAVSGRLDRTQFGPGTLNETHLRRSIYFTIKRSRLIPMLQIFDAPEPLVSVGQRPATTIASQALLFMNNSQVRSCAKAMAQAASTQKSPEDAVRQLYQQALSRPPSQTELTAGVDFLADQAKVYGSKSETLAMTALTDLSQTILCLNEFIYVE